MNRAPQKHWLLRPETIRRLWYAGYAVLALLAIADLFIHPHASFVIDGTFGFYMWYGFVMCVGMVLFAKALGVFMKRRDTYYDD
ncbi:MAG: hypothetical protein ACE5GW_00345 [Planctomycetota bacterium]